MSGWVGVCLGVGVAVGLCVCVRVCVCLRACCLFTLISWSRSHYNVAWHTYGFNVQAQHKEEMAEYAKKTGFEDADAMTEKGREREKEQLKETYEVLTVVPTRPFDTSA